MVGAYAEAAFWMALAAALFTVFSLLRFSFNIGVVERPLVQGLLWGVLTGDVAFAVSVSLVFELFWLDFFPAGTFIPPNAAASNLATLALCRVFGFHAPSEVVFPLLLSLPLAWMASRGEQLLRRREDRGYDTLQQWLRPESDCGYHPGSLIRRAALRFSAAYALFFLAGVTVLVAAVGWLLGQGLLQPPAGMFNWPILWLGASMGGLLALRVPGAYAVLTCGVGVAAVVGLFLG